MEKQQDPGQGRVQERGPAVQLSARPLLPRAPVGAGAEAGAGGTADGVSALELQLANETEQLVLEVPLPPFAK